MLKVGVADEAGVFLDVANVQFRAGESSARAGVVADNCSVRARLRVALMRRGLGLAPARPGGLKDGTSVGAADLLKRIGAGFLQARRGFAPQNFAKRGDRPGFANIAERFGGMRPDPNWLFVVQEDLQQRRNRRALGQKTEGVNRGNTRPSAAFSVRQYRFERSRIDRNLFADNLLGDFHRFNRVAAHEPFKWPGRLQIRVPQISAQRQRQCRA